MQKYRHLLLIDHGLFDYEEFHPDRKTFVTTNEGYLIRRNNTPTEMMLLTEEDKAEKLQVSDSLLLKVCPNKGNRENFTIENCSTTGIYDESIDKLWLVLNEMKVHGIKEVREIKHNRSIN